MLFILIRLGIHTDLDKNTYINFDAHPFSKFTSFSLSRLHEYIKFLFPIFEAVPKRKNVVLPFLGLHCLGIAIHFEGWVSVQSDPSGGRRELGLSLLRLGLFCRPVLGGRCPEIAFSVAVASMVVHLVPWRQHAPDGLPGNRDEDEYGSSDPDLVSLANAFGVQRHGYWCGFLFMGHEQMVFVLFVHGFVQLHSPGCFVAPETRSQSVVDRLSHRAFVAQLGTPRLYIYFSGP